MIEDVPTRVAVIGYTTDLDNVLALGVTPVLAVQVDEPWLSETDTEGIEWIQWSRDLDFEAIQAADPDVIVAVANSNIGLFYDQLSDIAPVVTWPEELGRQSITDWRESLLLTADVLGRTDVAESVIADVESVIAGVRADHPEFEGVSLTILENSGPDAGITYHSFTGSSVQSVLTGFGFSIAPSAGSFTATDNVVGPEKMETLVGDDLLFVIHDAVDFQATMEADPLFTALTPVVEGRYIAYQLQDDDGNYPVEKLSLVSAFVAPSAQSLVWVAAQFPVLVSDALPDAS